MLKKRVIPLLLWKEGRLVKTVAFQNPRVVGEPIKTCKVYSDQDADEIILLNIDRKEESREQFVRNLGKIAPEIMMPITVGGSVNSLADARILFEAGADKVLVNSASYNSPELLGNIADIFGSQALVAGVDFLRADDKTILFSHRGSVSEVKDLREHLEAVQESGVGEIMLQAIDRDGTKVGLDKEAIIDALSVTAVPLIVAGGIGDYSHIREAFDLGVDGVACGTLFNFGDNNPVRAKAYLRNHGIPLKISSFHGYAV